MSGELKTAVGPDLAGKTVLAALRQLEPAATWSQLRGVLSRRHVLVNGVLCLEEARRLRLGDTIERRTRPAPPPPGAESVKIVFRDADLLVVDKPEGLLTERRVEEARWSDAPKRNGQRSTRSSPDCCGRRAAILPEEFPTSPWSIASTAKPAGCSSWRSTPAPKRT